MKHCNKDQGESDQVKKACNVSSDAEKQFSPYDTTINMTEQELREVYVVAGSWRDHIFACALKKGINLDEF